jgi:plastocyanin
MKQFRHALVPILAAVLASCGGGGGGYGTGPGTTTNPNGGGNTTGSSPNVVTISNMSFGPASMTVAAGTTVTWKWSDCSGGDGYGVGATCVTHSVSFDDGSNVASPTQDQGTFSRTFTAKGTFKYHCAVHGPSMSGEVVVQ